MMIQHKGFEYFKLALHEKGTAAETDSNTQENFFCVQTAAVHSLLFLSEELQVHLSKSQANQKAANICSDVLIGASYHDVTFKMDDGRRVTGNRTLLSATSTVFAAMLEGAYKESGQTEIHIQDANTDAFQVLIKHLHGCDIQTALDSCCVEAENVLDILCEALALSDRYMLESLEEDLSAFICVRHLSKETVVRVFEVACVHTCESLIKACLEFVLSTDAAFTLSCDWLKGMLSGAHATAVFNTLHGLISDKLM